MKLLTLDDVLALMKTRQGKRLNKNFAKTLGISASYLSDIYGKKRDPGDSVLRAMGIERRVFYEANHGR
jgi:hypothetical protein